MIARRSFLSGILAAGMAPAIVKAGILMPLAPRIWVPDPLSPLSLRGGTNPQVYRIYNTYTDARTLSGFEDDVPIDYKRVELWRSIRDGK